MDYRACPDAAQFEAFGFGLDLEFAHDLIEHAIDKMRRGEYGLCEGTDEPIELRRLEARPWARFSVAHKEALEKDRAMHVG